MTEIQNIVDRVLKEFSEKPVATTLKGVIILWVLKQVKEWWSK